MCGRFTNTTKDTKKIADRFEVELEKALERSGAGAPAKESAQEGAEEKGGSEKKAPPGFGRFTWRPLRRSWSFAPPRIPRRRRPESGRHG